MVPNEYWVHPNISLPIAKEEVGVRKYIALFRSAQIGPHSRMQGRIFSMGGIGGMILYHGPTFPGANCSAEGRRGGGCGGPPGGGEGVPRDVPAAGDGAFRGREVQPAHDAGTRGAFGGGGAVKQ